MINEIDTCFFKTNDSTMLFHLNNLDPHSFQKKSTENTRYYCQTMFQHTGQELADNLKKCMTNALKQFHKVNGALPERIVVYRDGVGDGMVRMFTNWSNFLLWGGGGGALWWYG